MKNDIVEDRKDKLVSDKNKRKMVEKTEPKFYKGQLVEIYGGQRLYIDKVVLDHPLTNGVVYNLAICLQFSTAEIKNVPAAEIQPVKDKGGKNITVHYGQGEKEETVDVKELYIPAVNYIAMDSLSENDKQVVLDVFYLAHTLKTHIIHME